MAVAIPIIGAFATVASAGSIAAAVATVGGFLSVAGGVLAGIGALTDNKSLARLGGLMTLGSGIANLASAASASGAAAGEAAAESAAKSAFRTSELTAAQTAPDLGAAIAESGGSQSLTQAAEARAAGSLPAPGATPPMVPEGAPASTAAPPLGQTTVADPTAPAAPSDTPVPQGPLGEPTGAVQKAGENMTTAELQKYLGAAWDRTQTLLKNTTGFVRDNKELVSIVGNAFSPQAEQLDWQKSLYNRRRAALNSPVSLGSRTGG